MPEPQPNDNRTRMSAPQPNFQAQMTVCRKCGAQFPSNSVYCPMCGVSTLLGTSTLEVNIESKIVHDKAFKKKTLLKDINAEIKSGDFVLILGGSGAGKSTFIKAVLGESKANGKIVLDGQDLYKNFKKLKSQIGVVPQHSILRDEDSVKNTIYDAARIKLSDSSPSQIEKEVSEVMKRLGLDSIQNNLIRNISGGQMKKVAVATQLIGDQKVFVFDEPDSGLDVASRKQQMNILKDIADNDKTVLVITHAPDDAIDLFTKVLVLAKSTADGAGHVAYFGDVKNALGYFGTNKLQDIVIELNPKAEGGHGRSDEFIEKYRRTPQFTGR
jgi:ABC-type multidrug transport system ATPase subunit/ribosomal protein L40E